MISRETELMVYSASVVSDLNCGTETWPLTVRSEKKLLTIHPKHIQVTENIKHYEFKLG